MSEHTEQCLLFQWAAYSSGLYPELELLFAIPNGGWRHKATATKLRAEGVRRGVPDLMLPVARHGFHGLFIEMKYGRNDTTDEQKLWIDALLAQGFKACVCRGHEQAIETILDYIGGESEGQEAGAGRMA